jgi:DNA-directed RNA polymerase specialized sigma24 family protein
MNAHAHTNGTLVFLAILPQIERHALFAFRGVKDPGRHDDCVQETLALCWRWCCRLWEQGKDAREFPTTLASFATRHVRSGRSFVGKKTYRNDALSPLAQTIHGFLTRALPGVEAQTGSPWQAALQDNTQSPPDEQAAFRIDFPAFLATRSDRDRRIAEDMMLGDTTLELSGRHGVSPGRISQLRRQFHADWRAFTEPVA